MTALETRLLRSIRAELARLRIRAVPQYGDRFILGELRRRVSDAKGGILKIDFAELLGDLTDTERRAASRALGRLEAAGVLERLRSDDDSRNVKYVRLIEDK